MNLRQGSISRGEQLARLTASQRAEIRKLWNKRQPVWAIAQRLKIEPWKVYQICSKLP